MPIKRRTLQVIVHGSNENAQGDVRVVCPLPNGFLLFIASESESWERMGKMIMLKGIQVVRTGFLQFDLRAAGGLWCVTRLHQAIHIPAILSPVAGQLLHLRAPAHYFIVTSFDKVCLKLWRDFWLDFGIPELP